MAAGWPAKVNYATGDVLSASNMNDIGGTLNLINPYTAGKNAIINGDFRFNQRTFTSVTATATYTFDRFYTRTGGDGTGTFTPQVFTPGAAPVAGYEATNYLRIVTASSTSSTTLMCIRQAIEDVRTFAGQTITLSFWAKANSGTPKIAAQMNQVFGSGGSTAVLTAGTSAATISTSWARYSYTYNLPSITGKTIGTSSSLMVSINVSAGSDFAADNNNIGIQNNTFEIWGVQLEAGSTATPFQTASGTIGGELALCQRYYFRNATLISSYQAFGNGVVDSAVNAQISIPLPVTMRVVPTSLDYSTLRVFDGAASFAVTAAALNSNSNGAAVGAINVTSSGMTAGRVPAILQANGSTAGYVGFSAEL